MAALWDKEPALAKILSEADTGAILKVNVDYGKVNSTANQITRLDAQATKKLLGM
jgi:hypothetical protein